MTNEASGGEVPIRAAASLVLIRDRVGGAGIEFFMLERTGAAVFAAGMHVFPGGRVDAQDGANDLAPHLARFAPEQSRQCEALGTEHQAFYVAAIRECFEEAGFLFAYDGHGALVDTGDRRYAEYRQRLNAGEMTFLEFCRQADLRLSVDRLHFYHRWITPPGRPRRFDTRFFVARVPQGQEGIHDANETVSSRWISGEEALAEHAAGRFGLMGVTLKQLQEFVRFRSPADMLAAAATSTFPLYRP